jgi:acyl-CoA thioesterase-2
VSSALENLLGVIRPEPIGAGVYEGGHPREGGHHLFGGQVVAQGLAAVADASGGGLANSLHAHFLRRGTPTKPIRFRVETLRESTAFRTFEVKADQGDAPILQMTVSQHTEESGPVHQIPMDEVGPPAGETFERALLRAMTPEGFEDERTPFELPVEIRGVGGIGLFSTDVKAPQARCWIRVRGEVGDDPVLHQLLFAYASDYAIMVPALNPHPIVVTDMLSASLDHAIWFHRRFRVDEWLLFELDSPVATGARARGRGLLYAPDGSLVASCVQESLLRPVDAAKGRA